MDVLLVAHLMVLREYAELYFFLKQSRRVTVAQIAESASLPFTST